MKSTVLIGVILIVLGVLAFVYQGFTYTKREQIVKAGPVEITGQKKETVPIPPVVGTVAIVGGIVLVVLGARKA